MGIELIVLRQNLASAHALAGHWKSQHHLNTVWR
jgi:hypothetical protein